MDKDQLRQKYPNSSPEEIDALHAQIHSTGVKVGVVRDGVRILNDGNETTHTTSSGGANPHPDTSAANAALRNARKGKKSAKKKK